MNMMFHLEVRTHRFLIFGFRRHWIPLLAAVSIIHWSNPAISQTDSSFNIIGYADVSLVTGSNLVSNPFDAGDNTISNLFRSLPAGSQYMRWSAPIQDWEEPNVRAEDGSWSPTNPELTLGEAGFLVVTDPLRLSFTGQLWPRQCLRFPRGISYVSVIPEQPCIVCLIDCGTIPDGTLAWFWNPDSQVFEPPLLYNETLKTWLDSSFQPIDSPQAPLGSGVLLSLPFDFEGFAGTGGYDLQPVQLINPSHSGNTFRFEFPAGGDLPYRVRRFSGAVPSSWSTVLNDVTPSSGGQFVIEDTEATGPQANYVIDVFWLSNPVRGESTFSFDFLADSSRTYRILRSDNAEMSSSTVVHTIVSPEEGGRITVTDENATATSGYYSIRAE